MPQGQAELHLPPRSFEAEENEQDREARLHGTLLRYIEEAADDVGRKEACYALNLTEQLLSKQLREVDGNRPSYKLLAYLIKYQSSGRLAAWLMRDYAGFLPPQRPAQISTDEFAKVIVAKALGGEFGRGEAKEILDLYARVERRP